MQAPFIPAIVGSGAVRTALSISFSGTKNARADEASIARNAETSMPAEKARFPDPVKTMALTDFLRRCVLHIPPDRGAVLREKRICLLLP